VTRSWLTGVRAAVAATLALAAAVALAGVVEGMVTLTLKELTLLTALLVATQGKMAVRVEPGTLMEGMGKRSQECLTLGVF